MGFAIQIPGMDKILGIQIPFVIKNYFSQTKIIAQCYVLLRRVNLSVFLLLVYRFFSRNVSAD